MFADHEAVFPTVGRALDVACGRGSAVVWLARRGMRVHGLDMSSVAIGLARDSAERAGVADRCHLEVADLDDGLPEGPPVDLILCHLFRAPHLDAQLVARLAPGGLLTVAVLSEVGAGPGAYRARPGELREAFGALDVVEEGEGDGRAWLIARRHMKR